MLEEVHWLAVSIGVGVFVILPIEIKLLRARERDARLIPVPRFVYIIKQYSFHPS